MTDKRPYRAARLDYRYGCHGRGVVTTAVIIPFAADYILEMQQAAA